ncbi:MAG: trypsin-like peptidase domain-containing protein [Candidatus Poribacteria bacterium]|nr:trypsin-like peptidase domain-containing protein [Candidatus Poribacteria bacterium]
MISNKHVFRDSSGRLDPIGVVIIKLNRKKADGTPDFGNINTFVQVGLENLFDHPDPKIDLTCLDVSDIIHADAFHKHLHEDLLKPINYDKVAAGKDVIFIGYPNDRYDLANNLPLIRKGSIASMPNVDFNGRGQVVIDAQVFPGSSGSPVFVDWDNKYALLGVVSQTMIRDSKLEILPANMPQLGVQEVIGLGIVIKQKHVRELIDHTTNEIKKRVSPNS